MRVDTRLYRRLMLISNSFSHGKGYLEHCAEAIKTFLEDVTTITFIPYALHDWDEYGKIAREGFSRFGINVRSVGMHASRQAIENAEAIFVGGGNTFRLLRELYQKDLIGLIRKRVDDGMPYLGASAGANVACPTIMTTNDMPIVFPPSFNALDIFPYQINPHFVDADPASKHMGETREKRIAEFLEENETMVIGIREGSYIVVEAGVAKFFGSAGARLFMKGGASTEWTGLLGLW